MTGFDESTGPLKEHMQSTTRRVRSGPYRMKGNALLLKRIKTAHPTFDIDVQGDDA
jgi:hypothetical protein